METAVEAFRFVHGYVIIFEFKIFATNRFRAVHDFGKKMIRKSGMRNQRMQERQIISRADQRCMTCLTQTYFKP